MKSLMKLENRLKETGYFSEKELAIIIRDLPEFLEEDEVPVDGVMGRYNGIYNVLLLVTDLMIRFLFVGPLKLSALGYFSYDLDNFEGLDFLSIPEAPIFFMTEDDFVVNDGKSKKQMNVYGYIDDRLSGKKLQKQEDVGDSSKIAMIREKIRSLINVDEFSEMRFIDELASILNEDELIVQGIQGMYNNSNYGMLIATDQRLWLLYMTPDRGVCSKAISYKAGNFSAYKNEPILKERLVFSGEGYFVFGRSSGRKNNFFTYLFSRIEETSGSFLKIEPSNETEDKDMLKNSIVEDNHETPTFFTGNPYVIKIRQLNIAIEDQTISDYLDEMEMICRDIFSYVEKYPEKESEIRNFVDHYLPQTFSLLEKYDDFTRKPVKTSGISHSMTDITRTLEVVLEAFKNLYDRFYENEALEVSAEIEALVGILTQHGLTGKKDFDLK